MPIITLTPSAIEALKRLDAERDLSHIARRMTGAGTFDVIVTLSLYKRIRAAQRKDETYSQAVMRLRNG